METRTLEYWSNIAGVNKRKLKEYLSLFSSKKLLEIHHENGQKTEVITIKDEWLIKEMQSLRGTRDRVEKHRSENHNSL